MGVGRSVDPDSRAAATAAVHAAVRARDTSRGWQLSRHPSRLRISTIDALNAAQSGRYTARFRGFLAVHRSLANLAQVLHLLAQSLHL